MKLLADLGTNKKGLGLMELIIVIAVIAILASGAAIALAPFLSSTQIDDSKRNIVHYLRKAQSNANLRLHNSSWGVYFDDDSSPSITFFQGADYASRATSFDEVYEIDDSASISSLSLNGGGDEVVFANRTGTTTHYGSVDITSENGETFTITIDEMGLIESN